MAYMDQAKKKIIATNLKKVVPENWKYGLSVKDHNTIYFTLRSAPVNVLSLLHDNPYVKDYLQVNPNYLSNQFEGDTLTVFENIKEALNSADNYNDSDSQFDHFDIGYHIRINVGTSDKPFVIA